MAEQNFDNLRVTQQTYIGTGGDSDAQLHIWRNDNQEAKILLERAGSILLKLAVNLENVATLGTIGNSPLQLQAAGTSGIYLNTNGLVGVGTTNPSFNLDVQGTINATQFNKQGKRWIITNEDIEDNTISGLKIQNNSIPIGKLKDFSPPTGSQWVSGSSGSISYTGGNIGIGKPNPAFNLDIQGIINATQFFKNDKPWKITNDDIADNAAIDGNKMKDGSIPIKKIKDLPPSTSSQWVSGSSGSISYNGGNIGIEINNPLAKLQVTNGAIMPSAGNSETAGIMFPKDAFGGGGDAAWIRYYARTGEASTLEIGISNDGDDHIALMPSGNVGIGTANPEALLHVSAPTDTYGGNVKFFPTSGKGFDFSYDGGSDSIFAFTHYGAESGELRFIWQGDNNQFRDLLFIKNNGQVEVVSGDLFVKGKMVQASSRELKENITDFSTQEAIETLAGLNPVKYNYREDQEKELNVGFIAEDVPDLIATADRKAISPLEIVAVLTKVIKEQQVELSLLRERVNALEVRD